MALAYINLVKSNQLEFEAKVRRISATLGINPDWLMAVMYLESKLDHRATTRRSSAVGLIQFLDSTLLKLGLNRYQLLAMSNIKQLDIVLKYLMPYKGRMSSVYDVYLAVFSPNYIGSSDSRVLYVSGDKRYNSNNELDVDFNGNITVGDIKRWIDRRISSVVPTGNVTGNVTGNYLWVVIAVLFIFFMKIKR